MSSDPTVSPFQIAQEDCGCRDNNCCEPISRRDFLKTTGLASAAALFSAAGCCIPGAAGAATESAIKVSPHLIPADKKLSLAWLKSLAEKGEPLWWTGEELYTVGMPVGGIGTGQLYLCGDGSLGEWEIFNEHKFIGYGAKNYARRRVAKPVEHGITVVVEDGGKRKLRNLNTAGFSDVRFRGEYPIGTVRYTDPSTALRVQLEAFSPFIPLNAPDSALPTMMMFVTLENSGTAPIKASLLSWLENPVAKNAGYKGWAGARKTIVVRNAVGSRIVHAAEAREDTAAGQARNTVPFATFDGGSYVDWKVMGEAPGDAPSTGTLERQGNVQGFEGAGLVNTFHGRDASTGSMTSPEFTITRRFINFMIGGGDAADLVGMRLVVDGQTIRTAGGLNSETLTWEYWSVAEFEGKTAHLEIFDNSTAPWGHTLIDQIEFADKPRNAVGDAKLESFPDFGTLTWDCLHETASAEEARNLLESLGADAPEIAWEDQAEFSLTQRRTAGMLTKPIEVAPGQKVAVTFILAWHFPNTIKPDRTSGHEYAARFKDAAAVADYVIKNQDRLAGDTRKWRDTWYDSTLPVWLLDRLQYTVSCLATGTTTWWKNGRFWAWEGVVCCEGTCTHVWNYAQSMARLFPELERNVRERQDLGEGLQPDGLVGFRGNDKYAADGQCGTVLKVWREHLMSADDAFLKRNWEDTRKVIDFLLKNDVNADGILENAQHNTYDIDFHGANTFVGALYLGALRAGEQMAREMGDTAYADQLRKVYEAGRKYTEERLWNGEYFIQQVDLAKHPEHQYGPGCLSDQMFGQNWAHQTGLGYLYAPEKVRSALNAVWKYNWAPDTSVYNARFAPERPYTDAGEAGLFICTWPGSQHLDNGVRYRDEVWTGIEYQVASHMIYEGLIEEALAVCRAVHDRYHPMKRNPFNEVECSDFYARAMASYGVLQALSGHSYHGPRGELRFAPVMGEGQFRSSFTTAEGWGTFEEQRTEASGKWTVKLQHGSLKLSQLALGGKGISGTAKVSISGEPTNAEAKLGAEELQLRFPQPITIQAGQTLEVTV